MLVAISCAALVSLTAIPTLRAAAPNGPYQIVSATGGLKSAGQVIEMTKILAENFTISEFGKDPLFTIQKSRLNINRNGAVNLINALGERFGSRFDIDKVSGPQSILLKKSGKGYAGNTGRPIMVNFSIPTLTGERKRGVLKTVVSAKVVGKKLIITMPLKGSATFGYPISGTVTLVAKK